MKSFTFNPRYNIGDRAFAMNADYRPFQVEIYEVKYEKSYDSARISYKCGVFSINALSRKGGPSADGVLVYPEAEIYETAEEMIEAYKDKLEKNKAKSIELFISKIPFE